MKEQKVLERYKVRVWSGKYIIKQNEISQMALKPKNLFFKLRFVLDLLVLYPVLMKSHQYGKLIDLDSCVLLR